MTKSCFILSQNVYGWIWNSPYELRITKEESKYKAWWNGFYAFDLAFGVGLAVQCKGKGVSKVSIGISPTWLWLSSLPSPFLEILLSKFSLKLGSSLHLFHFKLFLMLTKLLNCWLQAKEDWITLPLCNFIIRHMKYLLTWKGRSILAWFSCKCMQMHMYIRSSSSGLPISQSVIVI